MIKKLRFKFLCIIMSILSIVLFFIFGSINIIMHNSSERQISSVMNEIANNDGRPLKMPPALKHPPIASMPQLRNTFSVKLDKTNNIISVVYDMNITYTNTQILNLVNEALNSQNMHGKLENNIRFLIRPKPYGSIIVFFDESLEHSWNVRLLFISICIGIISMIIIFIASLFLSSWAIKPVKDAFDKQREFIADASHELKTPLAVINANVDVLLSSSNSKWLEYIKLEANKMSTLVNDLLYLAKVDSKEDRYFFSKFNLSESIMNVALPFESVAFEDNKILDFDVDDNIYIMGERQKIEQVIVILIDNAIKNSYSNTTVKIKLKHLFGKYNIEVSNIGKAIPNEDKEKIFERFYKVDKSRNRENSGFGLGLSIAKSIVRAHNGKIYVECENNLTVFNVVLPEN